ncbi:RHS repeat-associated core domain-containing protein [Flavobacterium hydatis]|uniref:RHS repeat-associated core domain-containing protein n=2 Tax=Flavobacterium hydatis TaxID=991 RepID=A0ABX4CAS7_FLAHY|nr:RHS repeat-associated core domain-containing protein [Flavobacterium hydatis]
MYLIILFPLLIFSQPNAEDYLEKSTYQLNLTDRYPNYYQELTLSDLIYMDFAEPSVGNELSGSITINNNILTVNFNKTWAPQYMKIGIIKHLEVYPILPNTELGPILSATGGSQTGYFARIENNDLIIYSPYAVTSLNTPTPVTIASYAPDSIFPFFGMTDGSGTVIINQNKLSFDYQIDSGAFDSNIRGTILDFSIFTYNHGGGMTSSVEISDTDLGILQSNSLNTIYRAKIENNQLKIYATEAILQVPSGGFLNFVYDLTTHGPPMWYRDFDGDNFGSPYETSTGTASPPIGYVANNTDCDDNNILINPDTIWYIDYDQDGFGATNAPTIKACIKPLGYVIKSGDCNDRDATLNPDTIWFKNDTNVYYPVITSCSQPPGYTDHYTITPGPGQIPSDCFVDGEIINPETSWYFDGDGDTYGNNAIKEKGCTKPDRYVANNLDCDDSDITLNPTTVWYQDHDKDGFGSMASTAIGCTQPIGYVRNYSDYDDGVECITNIPPQTFYEDFDKDTFGNPNVSVYCSIQPIGYVINNWDYDDKTEYITNVAPQTFYEDFDTDNYGNPNVSVYRSIRPTNWVTNNLDCNDRAILINPNTKWYEDNELDGLGDPMNFVQQCIKPIGNYVDNNLDNCPLIEGSAADCSSIKKPSSDLNYIIATTYKKSVAVILANPSSIEAQVNITYFDGLGRPIQQIANQQSNLGKDIITHIGYDDFGRQTKEYLPYASTSTNMDYDTNAAINTINFYSTEKYENTANPFSEKKLESSALNRVLKQAAPGTDWAMGGGHEIKMDYQANASAEVKLYKATTNWNAGSGLYDIALSENGTYAANELFKTITYDENTSANPTEAEGSTIEFKDKQGQVVLKRIYGSGIKHDSYYVYDIYGNLTYIIPPKADGAINDEVLNGLCYQYKYDDRNRLIEKKLPGKQWEFIVYDKLDRPVATGPANSPFKDDTAVGWLITKYDVFGRPIYTGWLNSTSNSLSRKAMQDAQNKATKIFETKQTSGTIDGVAVNYSNNIEPKIFKLLTVNYYDNYNYPNVGTVPTTIEGESVLSNAKGLATGSWIRALTLPSVISGETNSTFYDNKARTIRNSYTQNTGYTNIDSKLDFTGKPSYTITKHKLTSKAVELTIKEEFTYSAQDHLLTHTHQINGGAIELLAANTYNELGQLIAKSVGNNMGNPLQKINYGYNIKGWLTEINKTTNLQQDTDPKDLFAFRINYNKVDWNSAAAKKLYNGNIAETTWTTGTDGVGVVRGYGYQYDQLNRLKDATYQTPNLTDNKNYFGENLDYDKNGNIMHLQRMNIAGISSNPYVGDMDNLGYFYQDNSNQLMKVSDSSNSPKGFKDDSNGSNDYSDDYAYDTNGNLIKDENKNITEIRYNHLNLPTKITFGETNVIEYIYNAVGQKLDKNVSDNGILTKTKYFGGFQYKNYVLQYFPTAEGYVNNTSINATDNYNYVFNYTDNLGNIRVSYKKNAQNVPEIIEESNYYPFGLKHQGYNLNEPSTYKYKYNGKEFQDELGLGLYDYGWRNYDPAIGRWINPDPLLNDLKFTFDDSQVDEDDDDEVLEAIITKIDTGGGIYNPDNLNPYGYGYDNPVSFADPDGRCPICPFIPLAMLLFASEPAMAPTKDHAGDSRKMSEAKEAKGAMILSTIPIARGASALNKLSNATKGKSTIKENAEKGKKWEKEVTKQLKEEGHDNVSEQITVSPNDGKGGTTPNVRVDNMSKKDGKIRLTDAKSSKTAGNTKNQKVGYPALEKHGGTVVGNKGAAHGYPAGTKIPPTKVDIIRPK